MARRNMSSYASRFGGDRNWFFNRLREQLHRRISGAGFFVSRQAVIHIWQRHGCYSNAKREQDDPKNRGKMPSYFRNHRTLVRVVAATILSPNWTKAAASYGQQRFRCQRPRYVIPRRGRGIIPTSRRRGGPAAKRVPTGNRRRPVNQDERRFYFKEFRDHVGYSGQGYGKQGFSGVDGQKCYCCTVLIDQDMSVVTAFPMLTTDAEDHGVGVKDVREKERDSSTFDSRSTISSSETAQPDEQDEEGNEQTGSETEPNLNICSTNVSVPPAPEAQQDQSPQDRTD